MKNPSGSRLKVAAVVAAFSIMLVGCSTSDPAPSQENTPATTTPSATTVAEETTAPAATELVDENPDDDFVPLAEVTDEYGTYVRYTLAEDSPQLAQDIDLVEVDMLEEHGFTLEQAAEAQRAVATYMIEEFLDGERLDNYATTYEQWIASPAGQYWPEHIHDELLAGDTSLAHEGMAVSDYLPSPLNRNGGARGTHLLTLLGVEAYTGKDTGTNLINVGFSFNSRYVTTEEKAQEVLASNTSQPAETFQEAMPALFDGDGVAEVSVEGLLWIAYDPETKLFFGSAGNWLPFEPESGRTYYTGDFPPQE